MKWKSRCTYRFITGSSDIHHQCEPSWYIQPIILSWWGVPAHFPTTSPHLLCFYFKKWKQRMRFDIFFLYGSIVGLFFFRLLETDQTPEILSFATIYKNKKLHIHFCISLSDILNQVVSIKILLNVSANDRHIRISFSVRRWRWWCLSFLSFCCSEGMKHKLIS